MKGTILSQKDLDILSQEDIHHILENIPAFHVFIVSNITFKLKLWKESIEVFGYYEYSGIKTWRSIGNTNGLYNKDIYHSLVSEILKINRRTKIRNILSK